MKNKMLEMAKILNSEMVENNVFEGAIELRRHDKGALVLELKHYNDAYEYGNSFIAFYEFFNDTQLEKFKKTALDCIRNNTLLEGTEVFYKWVTYTI